MRVAAEQMQTSRRVKHGQGATSPLKLFFRDFFCFQDEEALDWHDEMMKRRNKM